MTGSCVVPRANDPLAMLLYLIARNALPWGQVEKLVHKATSEVVPELLPDDPVAAWAKTTAALLREAPTSGVS